MNAQYTINQRPDSDLRTVTSRQLGSALEAQKNKNKKIVVQRGNSCRRLVPQTVSGRLIRIQHIERNPDCHRRCQGPLYLPNWRNSALGPMGRRSNGIVDCGEQSAEKTAHCPDTTIAALVVAHVQSTATGPVAMLVLILIAICSHTGRLGLAALDWPPWTVHRA